MNRETAEKLVDAAIRIDNILEELGNTSWEIEDEAERGKIRKGIAYCIIALYENVTREVVRDFPDLHPDLPPKN